MATPKKHVLITGGAGLIGRLLVDGLQVHCTLTSFDLAHNQPSIAG
jgi:nucleoside-diphosphate-sugar epimerase